jgi:hypothetical protein
MITTIHFDPKVVSIDAYAYAVMGSRRIMISSTFWYPSVHARSTR